MTARMSRPPSPARTRSSRSISSTTALSVARWSRASRLAIGTRRPSATRSIRRPRASSAFRTASPATSSTSRRRVCGWCRAMSAAALVCAARPSRNRCSCCSPRGAWGAPSNGAPIARRPSCAMCTAAITRRMARWRSTRTARSSRCASPTSPMSAPISRTMGRASAPRRARASPARSTTSPPCNCRCASPSRTPCRFAPIAAPAGRRSPTRWSGCSIREPALWGSAATKSAGAISSARSNCRTRTGSAS